MTAAAPQPTAPRLDFEVQEGLNLNRFVREGKVAAHLLLRSGTDPRIVIAFPAGNSGVGLWFVHHADRVSFRLRGPPVVVHDSDGRGRMLYGISADATVEGQDLQIRQAVLSSIRVLRDYQLLGTMPSALAATPTEHGHTVSWSRDRLDAAPGYRLVLEVTQGQLSDGHIRAGPDGKIGLRITGLTGETPLTALFGRQLLNESAGSDAAARDTLTFLAYREKLLAGSWRFDTYFGRDTLMAVRLLMPVLSATAVEAGLSSVLARLSVQGEVAHEEDIGERAVLDHLQTDGSRSAAPVFDYKMIDGDYLLAPVASAWLVHQRARARAAAFLAALAGGPGDGRGTRGAALVANLRFVLGSASAFAADPSTAHLIGLKSGFSVGEWRDSEDGIGRGRYPYDVDAVLVPAALEAAAQLNDSGLLSPYLNAADRALFARAPQMASVWRAKAPQLFDVAIPRKQAGGAIEAYAASQAIAAQAALAALGPEDLRFHAIALDASGKPIPVMHSDEGFALLFAELDAKQVDRAVTVLMRPFPAGLMTDAGMLVANPAFCAPPLQARFTRNAYHGTVVWSWQQALFAAGLERQLQRRDLRPTVRTHLLEAQQVLWSAINATRSINNSELWSWSFDAGHYRVAPFGAAAADADESNAAQLWSTVYLAVKPPHVAVNAAAGAR
ncbi:MAG: hypothetical protein E6K35_07875 [Gammaproteobacteria bacterium]|nr:MAG: hypothetical protein E6K35_07875 [Gammaproteobacteria bacterium]